MARNPFWTAADAATTTSLATWKVPDGHLSLSASNSTSYENYGSTSEYIGTYEVVDFITVNLRSDASYLFMSTGSWQTSLSIYDSQGYLLTSTDGSTFGLSEPYPVDSIVNFKPDTTGTYYLSVSWEWSSSTGSYTVAAAEDIGGDYKNGGGSTTTPTTPTVTSGLTGTAGEDRLTGSSGNDSIYGYANDDLLYGAGGADFIHCGADNDTAYGGDGADTVWGGQQVDQLYGEAGNDDMNGNLGADYVFGGDGNDTVQGGRDNDYLDGGAGDDLIAGNLGDDILVGGLGADTFEFRTGWGLDAVTDFSYSAGDRIKLAPGMTYTASAVSGGVLLDVGGGESLKILNVTTADVTSAWFVYA